MEQKAQLLERIFTLRDYSPFILVCDSLAQTAHYLLEEIKYRKATAKREVIVLPNLNQEENLAAFIQSHITPGVSVIGVYHIDKALQSPQHTYEPSPLSLLQYMATTIVRVEPNEEALQRLADFPKTGMFDFSNKLFNRPRFRVHIDHRRKTGRSFMGSFMIDSEAHTSHFINPVGLTEENQDIPENLTTFNLTLNEKQKKDRENVELPFFEAQQGPHGGGAIVYQYEKDDDYDEEDPYEDPF